MIKRKIKVLYVGHILFGDESATGNTLNNMFEHCENLEVKQLCMDFDPKYHVITKETFFIGKLNNVIFYCLKSIYRRNTKKTGNSKQAVEVNRMGNSLVSEILRGILDILPKRIRKKDFKLIKQYSPDVIYSLADNIGTLRMIRFLSNRLNIPIVMHFMDNIEDSMYNYSGFTKGFRRTYRNLLNECYDRTQINLAISKKMADEYEKRHNKPFEHAMNSLSELHYKPLISHEPSKLLFSGGLHGGRAKTLAKLASLIANDDIMKKRVKLYIFTSKADMEYYKDLFDKEAIIQEYVPREQLFDNLSNADILLHVESFEKKEQEYFRYSMSTKIPEYLSVGRPIICIGPESICSVSYLKEVGAALIINKESEFKEKIKLLLDNQSLRKQLGQNALNVAQTEHMGCEVGKRIEAVFLKSVL